MTHTYAIAEVSKTTYEEVRGILLDAGYQHAIHRDGSTETLDMHGIGLRVKAAPVDLPSLDDGGIPSEPLTPALDLNALREELAALSHTQWSGWMHYLFGKTIETIPPLYVKRWRRQMQTAYADLNANEKDSDRNEADLVIEVVKRHFAGRS